MRVLVLYRYGLLAYADGMSGDPDGLVVFDLGIKAAAALLGSSAHYIYKHRDDAGWPRYIRIGRKMRFSRSEFIAWMRRLPLSQQEKS